MGRSPAARKQEANEGVAPLVALVSGAAVVPPTDTGEISHNLAGQRLGRKGRDTRERIMAAAAELIDEAGEGAISMSSVARRASLGMTSLYNYFADFTEVVLALLEPVMAS